MSSWLHNLATWGITTIDSTEKDLRRFGRRVGLMPLSWRQTIIDHPEKDGLLWRIPDPNVSMANSLVGIQAIFVADYESAIVLKDGKLTNHLVLKPGSYDISRTIPVRGHIEIVWLTNKEVTLPWGVADVLSTDHINIGASGSLYVTISDPVEFVRKVAGSAQVYKQEHLAEFIKPEINAVMRKLIAQKSVLEFETARDTLQAEIKQDLEKSFERWGLTPTSLTIENQHLPEEYLTAVQQSTIVALQGNAALLEAANRVRISQVGVQQALYEAQAEALRTFLEGQANADVMGLLQARGIDPLLLQAIQAIGGIQVPQGALVAPHTPFIANIAELLAGGTGPIGATIPQGTPAERPIPQLEPPEGNSTVLPNIVVQPVGTPDPVQEQSRQENTVLVPSEDYEPLTNSEEENALMQQIFSQIQDLRQDFETKLKYDEGKQKTIDTLHKELEEHRTGLHFKILRPVFQDLIRLYDDLEKMIESMPEQSSNRTLEDLRLLQNEVVEILERYGAEAFSLDGPLQPNKQRVLKTIETTDSTLDKHIARSLRKGFSYENRILRHEQVVVYKFVGK